MKGETIDKIINYFAILLVISLTIALISFSFGLEKDTKKVKVFCEDHGYIAEGRTCYKIENSTIAIERAVVKKDGRFYFRE